MKSSTNVRFIRPELSEKMPYYTLIDDCLQGAERVKSQNDKYLPVPDPDVNTINSQRYLDYKKRAIFYNVTARTLSGITGLVYLKDANYSLPELLEPLKTDCTGEGISLAQLSKRALRWGMSFGRAGLWVDYPQTKRPATKDQIKSGEIQPVFRIFKPQDIINWRTKTVNGKVLLSLAVLKEEVDGDIDEFQVDKIENFIILRLRGDKYTVERIDGKTMESGGEVEVFDYKRSRFKTIPFYFIGAENNDSEIDHPPIYDMAELNMGHYRNSADYEEAVFTVGQPTVWCSGLTEEWVADILGDKITVGSRGILPLPENGQAGILQVAENTMAIEAMKHKEQQMIALGAKLVEMQSGNRTTATEAKMNDASETSILVNVAKNVSDAFTQALRVACRFVGADTKDVSFALQADLEIVKLDPQDLQQIIAAWLSGALSRTEMRYNLKRSGLTYGDENERLKEIDLEIEERQNQEQKTKGDPNGS